VINRTALAYPHIHFRLVHNDRTVAEYAAVTERRNRLDQVLGNDIAGELIPFAYRQNGVGVDGYLSSAPTSFPNARHLVTFVNRRYVRDKILTHAILQGYETLLMKGQYPAVVLSIEIPYGDVDVNVHPAKYEVRFRRQADIHEAVAHAVRQALGRQAKEPARSFPALAEPFSRIMEPPMGYDSEAFGSAEGANAPLYRDAFRLPTPAQFRAEGFFSSLNVLGQIAGCYLVCASSRGLALIDQHAAHERVVFEKLRRQMSAAQVEKQTLLIPQVLELSPGEMMLIEKQLAALEKSGFTLELFGPSAYAITAAPGLLPEGDYRGVVRQMLAELAEIGSSEKLGQHLEERLATIACHSVIRANRQLEMHEMRALLQDLDKSAFATQCPHGRPVLLEFSRDELERMFKRIV
jgi:DNA mismatch repair protein MutL